MKVSVVISAYNEEKKIEKALQSVVWADEIIVIDNESSDKTGEISKKHGAKVFSQKNNPMLNVNKNYGFSKATHDWILNLDADEVVTPELKQEIQKVVDQNSSIQGYWIPRKNIIFGKWIRHGIWWPDKQLRLFRKNKGKFPCIHVHEYVKVDGETSDLKEPCIHHNYETVSQYIRKLDSLYTENEVTSLSSQGHHFSWSDVIRYPTADFLKLLFLQAGYKDGIHGLVLASFQMFYTFVIYAKLWERSKFPEINIPLAEINKELNQSKKELSFWQKTTVIENEKNYFKKLLLKIEKKFL